ncbi:MAG: hypothetical protein J3K34DRAFT_386049 [Monoraphidium minutum]|nr:MAG: hypothetical protein J3K34DRAFT_386049 [Monoraphidium minutum]
MQSMSTLLTRQWLLTAPGFCRPQRRATVDCRPPLPAPAPAAALAARHHPHTARARVACAAGKGKGGGKGNGKQQQQQEQPAAQKRRVEEEEEEDEEDEGGVIYLDGDEYDEDEFELDEGMGFEDGDDGGGWLDDDDDDDDAPWGGGGGAGDADEPVRAGSVSTGGAPWGHAALEAARAVLGGTPALSDCALFALRCFASPRRVDVRIDKLTDTYGSPLLEDIETFSRAFAAKLEELLGPEEAGEIVLEVSSPGAERELVLPGDLGRFGGLPLRVEYDAARADVEEARPKKKGGSGGGGEGGGGGAAAGQQQQAGGGGGGGVKAVVAVLELLAYDAAAGATEWRLADVRANAPTKGRGLSKRQREQRWKVPVDALLSARVHVDF